MTQLMGAGLVSAALERLDPAADSVPETYHEADLSPVHGPLRVPFMHKDRRS